MAPLVRRTWSRRGHTPVLRQRTRATQKVSIIAALCVSPAHDRLQLYFRLHPHATLTARGVTEFLHQLRRQCPGPLVLLWDRLMAHRAVRVQGFLGHHPAIRAFFFPAYAPELNPIEYVWGYLKMNPLANLAIGQIDTLTQVTRQHTRALQRKPALLRAFLKHSPLFLRLK